MNEKYFKKENETKLDYIIRLVKNKSEYDLDYVELFRMAFGVELAPDECRKRYYGIKMIIDELDKIKYNTISEEKVRNELDIQLQELKKERMKISDERAALNRKLREQSRVESVYELIEKIAKENKSEDILELPELPHNDSVVGLLTLSDIHYGLEINEFNNSYNPEICRNRMGQLSAKVIENLKLHDITDLFIFGLGDYVEGLIHNIIRIESRESVIEQVMDMCEILTEFLKLLSKYANIYYYDVTDNHGRLFENKDNNLDKDNFSLLIKWYLKNKFEDSEVIHIMDNEINESIGAVNIFGRNYCFVHGHNDKIGDIVQNLSLMTNKHYDAIFLAHSHHFEANEIHGTYVYMNGTMVGADNYSNRIRKTSNPSQNFFVVSKEDGIKCQYLIRLK